MPRLLHIALASLLVLGLRPAAANEVALVTLDWPRAVVRAVHRALQFTQRHGDEIRAAAPGDTLRFPTAPDAPRAR